MSWTQHQIIQLIEAAQGADAKSSAIAYHTIQQTTKIESIRTDIELLYYAVFLLLFINTADFAWKFISQYLPTPTQIIGKASEY